MKIGSVKFGEVFMKKCWITFAILVAVLTLSPIACSKGLESPTIVVRSAGSPIPVVNPADPYTWFDKPLEGFRLSRQPYEVVLHASAYQGIAAIELRITGEQPLTIDNPAPGETLVTIKRTWTPPKAGRYVLQARTKDSKDQWSQTAVVTVDVVDTTTPTPTPTQTVTPTVTQVLQAGFTGPVFSPDVIVQNSSCEPKQLTATIGATDPAGVKVVVAFYRLVDKATGDTSDWASTAMQPMGGDKYTLVFQPAPLGGDLHHFVTMHIEAQGDSFAAWVKMQFAMQTNSGTTIRSQVYTAATLKNCLP